MAIFILKEAKKNNNLISFRKKNEDGLELWYSGYVKDIKGKELSFESIYGNAFSFDIREIIDLSGPKLTSYVVEDSTSNKPKSERKYFVFDTETTGLPKNFKAPVTDTDNWPRVIQFAWSICAEDGTELSHQDIIVKPEGFIIPQDSIDVHGITQEKAETEGIKLSDALEIFKKAVDECDFLVGHNISFDEMVVGCEFYRKNMEDPMINKQKICTKEASVDFCKIPGRGGRYSWASLIELYRIIFNKEFENQHNASYDVRACGQCFFELKRLGVIIN